MCSIGDKLDACETYHDTTIKSILPKYDAAEYPPLDLGQTTTDEDAKKDNGKSIFFCL